MKRVRFLVGGTLFPCFLALGLAVAGCGSDDDGDDDKKNSEKYSPESDTIPKDFKNTTTTSDDYSSKLESADSDIVADATGDLNIDTSTSGSGFAFGFVRKVASLQQSADTPSVDMSALANELEKGAACDSLYDTFNSQVSSLSSQIDSFKQKVAKMEGEFEASSFEDNYTVEDVNQSSSAYAFHYKMSPKSSDSESFSAFLPTLELAGGANDKQVVMMHGTAFSFDGGENSDGSLDLDLKYRIFADTEAKKVVMGMDMNSKSTDQNGKKKSTKAKTKLTLQGGETPSLVQVLDVDGSAQKGSNLRWALTKTGEQTYTIEMDGKFATSSIAKTITVTKTADSCTVKNVEG